jgi:hypothetical protein
MCYIPFQIWKYYEYGTLTLITQEFRKIELDISKSNSKKFLESLKKNLKKNEWFATVFVCCNIINFGNIIGQLFLINNFLGGVFWQYGTNVIFWLSNFNEDGRTDPMIEIFPRFSDIVL